MIPPAAALAEPTINFHFTVSENSFNRYVNACVEINSLPENGLECDTVLYLEAKTATASTVVLLFSVVIDMYSDAAYYDYCM